MELEIYTDFNRHGAEAVSEAREAECHVGIQLLVGVGEDNVRLHLGRGVEVEAEACREE